MSEAFEQGYAVVIGVGADLPVTVNDANAIVNQLRDATHCAYPSDQVRLLTGKDATRTGILSALCWLAETATETDTAIVYFSGHGMETPGYYLIPYGCNIADLAGSAISDEMFTEQLRAVQTRKLLVLLDCCHAGGQAEAKGLIKSPLPISVTEYLRGSSGRVVIASSRKDELSWAGEPYSVFTAALLEALAGAGTFEQDGYARVLDMTMWVGRRVPECTSDKQHPIIKVNNLEDNFAVAWYAGGDKTPPKLSSAEDRIPLRESPPDVAQVTTWKTMLANHRANLLLIEERMSEYVDFLDVPLHLVKNKRRIESEIADLSRKLGTC